MGELPETRRDRFKRQKCADTEPDLGLMPPVPRRSCATFAIPAATVHFAGGMPNLEERSHGLVDTLRPLKPSLDSKASRWWPDQMGEAASSGSSDELRYAYFPRAHRLLLERHGELTIYDTGLHQFRGALRPHGSDGMLSFTSQNGRVTLDLLKIIPQ
jgi:hypothetical protein